jgi:hypothetical protein
VRACITTISSLLYGQGEEQAGRGIGSGVVAPG